ncbi:MAG: DUF5723 family protein [Bacteroidia bacterium]
MKRISLGLLLFFQLHNAFGQEMLGIVNSNFSGNVGITLNPATVVGMPFSREFNLISMDISAHNNYLYYPAGQHGLVKLITGQGLTHDNTKDYYTTTPDKQMYANIFLLGPSYSVSTISGGWAIHTALRTNFSVNHLNYHLAKFLWDGFDYLPQQDIDYKTDPYQLNMLQWYEIGYTYGLTLYQTKTQMLTVGATVNLNLGVNSTYIDNKKMDYRVPSSDTLLVYNLNATYAHTIITDNPGLGDYVGVKGFGGGINLGVQYYKNRDAKGYYYKTKNRRKYEYKFGASLIDMGMVHFFKDNRVNKFDNNSTLWPGIDTVKFNGINDFDQTLNNQFTGSPDGALTNKKINMFLPTAASVQFDYNIYKDFYANATWIQRLSFLNPQIKRANEVTITARYETSKFEVAIPYSFYEYYKHRVGLAFRFKWFFVDTDKFGPIIDAWDVDGLDFYFGIKFTNHKNPNGKGRKGEDCPAYK